MPDCDHKFAILFKPRGPKWVCWQAHYYSSEEEFLKEQDRLRKDHYTIPMSLENASPPLNKSRILTDIPLRDIHIVTINFEDPDEVNGRSGIYTHVEFTDTSGGGFLIGPDGYDLDLHSALSQRVIAMIDTIYQPTQGE